MEGSHDSCRDYGRGIRLARHRERRRRALVVGRQASLSADAETLQVGAALPPRLRWYVLATIAVGRTGRSRGGSFRCARPAERTHARSGSRCSSVLAILAEWRPVPIDVEGKRLVSLAFVFIISSQLLFGWEWSMLIGGVRRSAWR